MLEWLKRHVWKACGRQKRLQGSNPCLSANRADALIFNKLDAKLDLKRDKIGTSSVPIFDSRISDSRLPGQEPESLQIATGIHVVYMLFQNALGLMEFGNSLLDQSFGKARV